MNSDTRSTQTYKVRFMEHGAVADSSYAGDLVLETESLEKAKQAAALRLDYEVRMYGLCCDTEPYGAFSKMGIEPGQGLWDACDAEVYIEDPSGNRVYESHK